MNEGIGLRLQPVLNLPVLKKNQNVPSQQVLQVFYLFKAKISITKLQIRFNMSERSSECSNECSV